MNQWKLAVEAKTEALIAQGVSPEVAARRARKACRHLHPAHKRATTRKLHFADARFSATGKIDSYNRI
jgi:hypothetical protein